MSTQSPLFTCARCGREIKSASTQYIVSITLVADFNGTIPQAEGQDALAELYSQIAAKSQDELENEVHQKLTFVLCKPCRDEFVKNPAGRKSGEAEGTAPH